jgi:hypothetical protein
MNFDEMKKLQDAFLIYIWKYNWIPITESEIELITNDLLNELGKLN